MTNRPNPTLRKHVMDGAHIALEVLAKPDIQDDSNMALDRIKRSNEQFALPIGGRF
jgi:hypothetical protein